jgi:hypothetical protein
MFKSSIKSGDVVVYRKHKHTPLPGPRARQVHAATKGDCYNYIIDKFWIVGNVLSDGRLLLRTRGGKTHVVDCRDPNLRRATFWDRLRHRTRFGQLQRAMSDPVS